MASNRKASTPPPLARPRMPLSQRAKIFIPFDPLKGYQDALREKEREAEMRHRLFATGEPQSEETETTP